MFVFQYRTVELFVNKSLTHKRFKRTLPFLIFLIVLGGGGGGWGSGRGVGGGDAKQPTNFGGSPLRTINKQ